MIKFAAICPHPPLLIPGIGSKDDLKLVSNTIKAMEELADGIEKNDIETIVLVTPHNMVFGDRMNILDADKFAGDFEQFGFRDIKMNFDADHELIDAIGAGCETGEIPYIKNSNTKECGYLDHGAMVPLHYLTKLVGSNIRIVLITYSNLDRTTHIKFGKVIEKVCSDDKFKDTNIALIASGDMSHRLFSGEPAGHTNEGKEFDELIVNDLNNNDIESITHYDEDFVEAAGECGYRSILVLMGALKDLEYKSDVLSYEGPYGVGYLVVKFDLD